MISFFPKFHVNSVSQETYTRYFLYQPVTSKWALQRKQRSSESRFLSDTEIELHQGSRAVVLMVAEAGGYTAPGQTGLHGMTLSQKSKIKQIENEYEAEQIKAMNHLIILPSALKLSV